MTMYDFNEQVALVTGGGSGIGESCAWAFANRGAKVAILDIKEQAAQQVSQEINDCGGQSLALSCDVRDTASIDDAIGKVLSAWGKLDIAVNSAGIAGPLMPTAETGEEDFDRVVGINLKGVWASMRAELGVMATQQSGVIVNIASTMSLRVHPGNSLYVASKFGVAGLTRTAAVEYASAGIRVNAICPGSVPTALFSEAVLDDETNATLKALHPMNRLGTPEEISNATLWLASSQASFCTGVLLPVDGGWTAQ